MQAVEEPSKVCLPITINIMTKIKTILSYEPHKHQNIMTWAACCTAFFGFFRCSEFTAPSQDDYNPHTHLSYHDVVVDNCTSPTLPTLQLKQSKMDPFCAGVSLTLGKTDKEVWLQLLYHLWPSEAHKRGLCSSQRPTTT